MDDTEVTDNNVTKLFSVVSDNTQEADKPSQSYYIQDIDGEEFVRDGFCVFTSQHVAIMRDQQDGSATPILVIPLARVKIVDLIEDDGEDTED